MKDTARTVTAALLATGLFAFSSAALATNGYFTHGVGAESKAMGGSGVGSSDNMGAISSATNPALAVFADEKWQVGMSVFSPIRSYTTNGGLGGQQGAFTLSNGEYDSKNEAFPIPYVGKNWMFSNGNALSVIFYGRGGMNTEWDGGQTAMFDPFGQGPMEFDGVYGGGISGLTGQALPVAGVDLMQAFLGITYAGKIGDNFAWGIGPVVAVQMFEATGLSAFAGYTQTYADYLVSGGDQQTPPWLVATSGTDNSSDISTGFGGSVGIWTGNDKISLGLAYQTKMSMSEFDDYSDLFAQDGGFDIPSTLKAGLSFKTSDAVTLNFDVEQIGYSDVDSVGNPIMNMLTGCFTANPQVAPATDGCLGGPTGAGFGWDDMTVYKLGVSVASSDTSTWRFGYSYGEQPIQSSEVLFNILAPGVMEQHFTLGWTGVRPNGNVMSFAFMYAPENSVSGASTFDPFQTIELKMTQLEFEFAYRF